MGKENRIIKIVKVDEFGNMKEESNFDNALKWDSPSVAQALRKHLKKGRK